MSHGQPWEVSAPVVMRATAASQNWKVRVTSTLNSSRISRAALISSEVRNAVRGSDSIGVSVQQRALPCGF